MKQDQGSPLGIRPFRTLCRNNLHTQCRKPNNVSCRDANEYQMYIKNALLYMNTPCIENATQLVRKWEHASSANDQHFNRSVVGGSLKGKHVRSYEWHHIHFSYNNLNDHAHDTNWIHSRSFIKSDIFLCNTGNRNHTNLMPLPSPQSPLSTRYIFFCYHNVSWSHCSSDAKLQTHNQTEHWKCKKMNATRLRSIKKKMSVPTSPYCNLSLICFPINSKNFDWPSFYCFKL